MLDDLKLQTKPESAITRSTRRSTVSATILQINFNFDGSWAEYESGNAAGAAQIAAIPAWAGKSG